jgi:hypothetical protein
VDWGFLRQKYGRQNNKNWMAEERRESKGMGAKEFSKGGKATDHITQQ